MKVISLLLLILCCFSLFAQRGSKNLVPNPSFEDHKNKSPDIKNAIPWKGVGTVDYYMKPDKADTTKYKGAHKGTCFAGLRFQEKYREYMYVQLLEPLEKGRTYHFRMYVRLLNESTMLVKQLGVYFSEDPYTFGMKFDENGLIDSIYQKGISGKLSWMPIQGNYVAHGGEKYIIIGNFSAVMKNDFVKRNKFDVFTLKEAYYFVDDVSLRKKLTIADSTPAPTVAPKPVVKKPKVEKLYPSDFTTGQVVMVKNIYFEPGTAKLKLTSDKGLAQLESALNNHPFMEVQFNGYTDNTGNESTNRNISKERAKAVYEYLKKDGITNPMTYKGFGEIKPLFPNDTEENRAKNRRIEMVIIKN